MTWLGFGFHGDYMNVGKKTVHLPTLAIIYLLNFFLDDINYSISTLLVFGPCEILNNCCQLVVVTGDGHDPQAMAIESFKESYGGPKTVTTYPGSMVPKSEDHDDAHKKS